jgi:hypothetical protein
MAMDQVECTVRSKVLVYSSHKHEHGYIAPGVLRNPLEFWLFGFCPHQALKTRQKDEGGLMFMCVSAISAVT